MTAVVQYTADDLATSASESSPFASEDVTSLWVEMDVDPNLVLAGGSLGGISVSTDAGATWTAKTAPEPFPILRAIASRFAPGEYHVLTEGTYYVSYDGGVSWITILSADTMSGETFYDLVLSHTRNMISGSLGVRVAEASGALLTGPTGCVEMVAITADIREDKFYAVAANGNTWVMAASGDSALIAGAAVPAGCIPQLRGLWRDGAIPGLIFIAGGTGGAWKSVDGLGSSGGYFILRTPGADGAGAGPCYQIGQGILESPPYVP